MDREEALKEQGSGLSYVESHGKNCYVMYIYVGQSSEKKNAHEKPVLVFALFQSEAFSRELNSTGQVCKLFVQIHPT